MGKIKVYVSIPISGHNPVKQRAHVLAVIDRLSAYFEREKPDTRVVFINPFEIGDALERLHNAAGLAPPTWSDYMNVDIPAMLRCDVVYMCKGWEMSNGCRIEQLKASVSERVIMYEGDD
jgi:hypothetical protein